MFYKYENGELHHGVHVHFPDGKILHEEFLDTYKFPVDGWYYFKTESEAHAHFNKKDD